ncbi:hypothetical protein AURDEDRAFT_153372, partial [Auricularia subglabra TFB-10046 SS5]
MEFGSTFVLAAPREYEGGNRHGVSRTASFRQRLRSLSISGGNNTCVVHLLDPSTSKPLPEAERARRKEQCMRDADGFALVYDVRSPDSFRTANLIFEECSLLNKPIILCANFSDCMDDESVPYASALAWGRARGVPVLRTSAKTGVQVEDAFMRLTRVARRSGRDYTFTILGAHYVGKTSLAMRFCYNSEAVPKDVAADGRISNTRKVAIPVHRSPPATSTPTTSTEPQASSSRTRPNGPAKLRKKRSMSVSTPQSRGPSVDLRKSYTDHPPLPTLSGSRSLVDMHGAAQASRSHPAPELSPQSLASAPFSPIARHRRADCNILLLNLGSLAPDDPNTKTVARGLRGRPPMCPECGARSRGGARCAFCGAPTSAFVDLRAPPTAEEYPLVQRFQSVSWSVSDPASLLAPKSEKTSLTVFCVDVSSSVKGPHETRYEQILWRRAHGHGAEEHISRLQCVQDAILLHLERLRKNHPTRKVAILLVTGDVDVSFSGLYASHRIRDAHGYIRTLKQGLIHGEELISPYSKGIDRGYDALVRQVQILQPSAHNENALGVAIAVALGLAKGHLKQGGTGTEILLCSQNAANVGLGNMAPLFRDGGRDFYAQAREMTSECKATFSIVSASRNTPDIDILADLARRTGGCVSVMDEPKLHLLVEPRRAGSKRIVAGEVEAKLYLPRGWRFDRNDAFPHVRYENEDNIAAISLPQVDDDTLLSLAFHCTSDIPLAPDAQFVVQAQILYTNP